MRVKKVPLQDLELWPDEVICFSAYTDTRNPIQQRRTYVDGAALKAENAKLRELVADVWRDIPKSESCGWDIDTNCCSGSDECKGECAYWYRMHELGIEVQE